MALKQIDFQSHCAVQYTASILYNESVIVSCQPDQM